MYSQALQQVYLFKEEQILDASLLAAWLFVDSIGANEISTKRYVRYQDWQVRAEEER